MATKNESFLIADTSGLISLTVTTDRNHTPALAAVKSLLGKRSNILVPYEVFVETVNVLGKRLGHSQAYDVASYLSDTRLFLILDSSQKARHEALQRFQEQPQAVSFTDCIVMALAETSMRPRPSSGLTPTMPELVIRSSETRKDQRP